MCGGGARWLGPLTLLALCWLAGGELSLSIHEPSAAVANTIFLAVPAGSARVLPLVPGRTYRIGCHSTSGFGGRTDNWLNGSGGAVDMPSSLPPEAAPAVFSTVDGVNRMLVIQNFEPGSAAGVYTCDNHEDSGEAEEASIDLQQSEGLVTAIPGSTFDELTEGTVSNDRPTLHVFLSPPPGNETDIMEQLSWTLDGQSLSSVYLISLYEVLLPNTIFQALGGSYVATYASPSFGTTTATIIVQINTLPVITLTPTEAEVGASSSLTILCQDSQGSPPPSFSWEMNGALLANTSRISITALLVDGMSSSTLTLNPVLPGDEGQYSCGARNAAGSSRRNSQLLVVYPPILRHLSPAESTQVENSTVVLRAELVGAHPAISSVVWLRAGPEGNVTVDPSQPAFAGYTLSGALAGPSFNLSISRAQPSSTALYFIQAHNSNGTGVLAFDLSIIAPPVLAPSPSSPSYRATGSNATFSVTILRAHPPVSSSDDVVWYNGLTGARLDLSNMRVRTSLEGNVSVLSIVGLGLSDGGSYRLQVAHTAGNRSVSFELTVQDPPQPPTALEVSAMPPCSARVWWTPPPAPPNGDTAHADVTVVQVQLLPGGGWEEVGEVAVGNSTVVRLPGAVADARYQFRLLSRSLRVGDSTAGPASSSVDGYLKGDFPSFSLVAASPVASSEGSSALLLRWGLAPQDHDCFTIQSFRLWCSRPGGSGAAGSAGMESTEGRVMGLLPDTSYSCLVAVSVSDGNRSAFSFQPESNATQAATYPSAPGKPPKAPAVVDLPDHTSFQIEFSLPPKVASIDISHYHVVVLRLETKDDIPAGSPDKVYPSGLLQSFPSYEEVNAAPSRRRRAGSSPPPAYVAAMVPAANFSQDPALFTVGDEACSKSGPTCNGALLPGALYSAFLRAFPLSSIPGRPPVSDVFVSSDFAAVVQTEPEPPPTEPVNAATRGIIIGVVVAVVIALVVAIVIVVVVLLLVRARSRVSKSVDLVSSSLKLSGASSPDPCPLSSREDTISPESIDSPEPERTPDLARREKKARETSFIETETETEGETGDVPSGRVLSQDFLAHVEHFDANRQRLFQQEFDWIANKSPWHPAEASNDRRNDEKNRYSNITAFDHSRVLLSLLDGQPVSDYINANYIDGFHGPKEYIATQGPLEQTVCDFWRLVWEQNTATIVMLTNLMELGKVKCTQYWPESSTTVYANVLVTLEHSVVLPDYTIRRFSITHKPSGCERTVLQFHYTKWPDYGTPKLAAPLLNFIRAFQASNPPDSGPVVIHCSAGVGRSGTVITIDHALHQHAAEGVVNIRGFVSRSREQRNYMVQTEQQYTFIHYAVLEALAYGDTSFALGSFSSSYGQLQEPSSSGSGRTLLHEEFDRLGSVRSIFKKSSFVQPVFPRRGRHLPPPSSSIPNGTGSEDFSAHYIDGYFQLRQFVVSDGPSDTTAAQFWQMVWEQDCGCIVMLTPFDAPHHPYWPGNGAGSSERYGNMEVTVESETAEQSYNQRTLVITNAKTADGTSHKIHQFQFIRWTRQCFPPVPAFVAFVGDVLRSVESLEQEERVVVHDTTSVGPAGVFCALACSIERLRIERVVDIFQAVQKAQLQRPGAVQSLQQYAYLYDSVYEFIRIHFTA